MEKGGSGQSLKKIPARFNFPCLFAKMMRPKLIFLCLSFFGSLVLASCKQETKTETPAASNDCRVYIQSMHKLERQLLESEKNANQLEDVIFRLTQNYMVIDQKIRLIQKYKGDPDQKALLSRTASEIDVFFTQSQALLDSTEAEIRRSSLPQSSMIPIIESVREYLGHQEKLFIEVYGSLGSIQEQVARLKKKMEAKELEISQKEQDAEQIMAEKEKQNRRIFYLVGNKTDLLRAKAIQKTGGILGVGGSIKLSDKLDEMFFQSGDYEIIKDISLGNTKKPNLVSVHPKGSYLLMDTPGEKFLRITNPPKFWSTSKYLVVEID